MRLGLVLILGIAAIGCRSSAASPAPRDTFVPGTRTTTAPAVMAWLYAGDLQHGWQDHGWSPRKPRKSGEPERHVMTNYGGWILSRTGFTGQFGGLVFRMKTTPNISEFLEVRLDSEQADLFPRVKLTPAHRLELPDGWSEIFIPMSELNPTLHQFDHVVFRAFAPIPAPGLVEIDRVGLTLADADQVRRAEAALSKPGLPAAFAVDCSSKGTEISPLIYGIALNARKDATDSHQWKLNATSRRWGGNPMSRYNWVLGNAWNTASDYYFYNVDYTDTPGYSWKNFLELNRDRRVGSAITLPIIGWVAKDTKSAAWPKGEFPQQQSFDPDGHGAGNGMSKDGKPLQSAPGRTSIEAPPEFVAKWVSEIRSQEEKRGKSVDVYFLDNEPALWSDTHRDIHPEPVSYDELLDRTIRYGTAVRKAAPNATIAGPAEWGWPGYFFSAVDAKAGFRLKPDRRMHGDVPLLAWWLRKLAENEKKTGTKILDVLDLHYYPQAQGMGVGTDGKVDPDTAALRIRSTRSLWDPKYIDESWIKEPIQLIPRMRELVKENYPGLKLALGEYNFGAEKHLSGGLALAEALGRFGQEGLYAAWYWTYPPEGSPAFWAFRAFRDYDGKGAHFAELSLPTTAPRDASLFAARSADGKKITLVALNFSPNDGLEASVDLKGCAIAEGQRVFTYAGDSRGFVPREVPVGKSYRLPPYSISVIELAMPIAKK
jgi:hypothetical protein